MDIAYKFYLVADGCMGHIGNNYYRLFCTEDEYREWYNNSIEDDA